MATWHNTDWTEALTALANRDTGDTERDQAIKVVQAMVSVHCQTNTDGLENWIASVAADNTGITPRRIAARWDAHVRENAFPAWACRPRPDLFKDEE
jgi:hypothetical protein